MPHNDKLIGKRRLGMLTMILRWLVPRNWCLKRSQLLYAVASKCLHGEVRINVAMRCRNDVTTDWGHAWLSLNGNPLWEWNHAVVRKPMTKISDTGKYVYWIYNS